jgi:Protein of unknown function (DUF2939)
MPDTIQEPKRHRSGWIVWILILVLALGGLYYVISPFLFLGSLQTAFRQGDSTGLENLVNFPSVRQSLKAQLSVAFTEFMNSDSSMKDNPFLGLGILLGPAMIDRVVESYCTPEMIASMAKTGSGNNRAVTDGPMKVSLPDFSQVDWSKLHFRRQSLDSFSLGKDEASLLVRWEGLGWKVVKLEISPNYLKSRVKSSR